LLLPHFDPLRKRPFPPSETSHNGKAMYPNRIRNKLTIVIYVNDFLRREEKAVKNQCVGRMLGREKNGEFRTYIKKKSVLITYKKLAVEKKVESLW
jgi:hypothetical protein